MPSSKIKEKTPEEISAEALAGEIRIRRASFEKEAKMRAHLIEQDFERANHNILVAEHDIEENIRNGLKKIKKINDGIMLPEDLA